MYKTNRSRKILALVMIFFVIVITLIIISILSKTVNFVTTPTNIVTNNNSLRADENSIKGFNGAAFYKIDTTKDSSLEVLGGGVKLPAPEEVIWAGDEGLLLNFDKSYINTEVDKYAKINQLSDYEREYATWYFSFKDNQLYYAGNHIISDANGVYSTKDNGIYYATEPSEGLPAGKIEYFNIETKKYKTLSKLSNYSYVRSITACRQQSVCVSAVNNNNNNQRTNKLFTINKSGKTNIIDEVVGLINPIDGTNSYVVLDDRYDESKNTTDAVANYSKLIIKDEDSKKETEINRNLYPDSFMIIEGEPGRLGLIGNPEESIYTSIGSNISKKTAKDSNLKQDNGEIFSDAIVLNSKFKSKQLLINSSGNKSYIMAPESYVKNNFYVYDEKYVKKEIDNCAIDTSNNDDSFYLATEKLFTFYVNDDDKLSKNIKSIYNCLSEKPENMAGYNFSFISVSPTNGRPTSY